MYIYMLMNESNKPLNHSLPAIKIIYWKWKCYFWIKINMPKWFFVINMPPSKIMMMFTIWMRKVVYYIWRGTLKTSKASIFETKYDMDEWTKNIQKESKLNWRTSQNCLNTILFYKLVRINLRFFLLYCWSNFA